jgi:hypothetical protein
MAGWNIPELFGYKKNGNIIELNRRFSIAMFGCIPEDNWGFTLQLVIN